MQHTLRAFDDDIDRLRGKIGKIGDLAQRSIAQAMQALRDGDDTLARQVIADDKAIDELEQRIDQLAIRTLALRAPMADDLRDIVAVLKMASIIERIGDYAKNIARRVPQVSVDDDKALEPLLRMGKLAGDLVALALSAFAERDEAIALTVAVGDDAVDALYADIFRDTLVAMADHSDEISERAHALFIAKHLERIGDHATNLAEIIYYAEMGEAMPEPGSGAED